MKVLIIDNSTKHLQSLKNLLLSHELTILTFSSTYSDTEQYDLIVLSGGSKFAITQKPEIFANEIELIKNSSKPIIGICEGCEIIAYAYGSKLESFSPKVKGIKTIQIIDNSVIDFKNPINVYEAHHWAIKELGKDLIGIAKSDRGWEIIKHENKPVYGFQFHPEMFVDKARGDEIFKSIVKIIT